MILNHSYFFGDLAIGQLDSEAVQDKLDGFIEQCEPEYLEALMGYETYQLFLAGIITPAPNKWLDILTGKEYTDLSGHLQKWKGLIRDAGTVTVTDTQPQIEIVVGRGQAYDPANNAATTTIPAELVGTDFVFMQRAYGPLRSNEFSVAGNVLTLLGGLRFTNADTYFYFPSNPFSITTSGTNMIPKSPIANFVYYKYQRSQVSNTGGTGEVKTKQANSEAASSGTKMANAWHKMFLMNNEFVNFMYANQADYPEWFKYACRFDADIFHPMNTFNI